MVEIGRDIQDVARLALVNKDMLHLGPPEGQKRPYDSEVYTPAGKLGFETISRAELTNLEPPDLSAFEGSPRRNVRDNLLQGLDGFSRPAGQVARTLLEKGLGKTSQPFALDHTLGHLRHPDLYLTVGPPMYDTVLIGHIAQTAALALENNSDDRLDTYRARQMQDQRWRRRFATGGEDWFGQLLSVTEEAKRLVKSGGNYAERFPIDARTQINLKYAKGDKGNELVVHNIGLLRQRHPEAVREQVATDDLVRANLDKGLILPTDVLQDPTSLPATDAIVDSMDFYMGFCDRMRSLVGPKGDVEAISQQQGVFEKEYASYAG